MTDLWDIQYVVVTAPGKKKEILPKANKKKPRIAEMPEFNSKNSIYNQNIDSNQNIDEQLSFDDDLLMEQIVENINSTPLGKVLKRIASLPEVNKRKVLGVRRQLTEGSYDLNERLDTALDKVLDELIA